jgi:hypothetical protein
MKEGNNHKKSAIMTTLYTFKSVIVTERVVAQRIQSVIRVNFAVKKNENMA